MKYLPGTMIFILLFLTACTASAGSGMNKQAPQSTGGTDLPTSEQAGQPSDLPSIKSTLLPQESPPVGVAGEFKTDFSKHTIPYREILSGGPPKDGIPSLDHLRFVPVAEADVWLKPVEPVIFVQVSKDARAYPLQILIWHEIVNDTVGGLPLVVTFCPLCNTAIAFERTVNGQELDFGTTGRLRYSNLIMYDRQTETWWQQAIGEAIAGELTGLRLNNYPASIISWEEFKSSYPEGKVLSRETGFSRSYGQNPYVGYDDVNNPPFLYKGPETPGVLPPVARVLTVDLNGEAVAYPYDVLKKLHVVNDTDGGEDIVVLWAPGTSSALDAGTVAGGRDVGTSTAYSRQIDGKSLTFTFDGSRIVDQETGSEWNLLGKAVNGALAGKMLEPVVAINHFWFSWAAFKPETRVYQP